MMAAATAARDGHTVTLIEQNEKLGKKLFITGKGRCNITNAGGQESFFSHVIRNPRFLYSAYHALSSEDICSLLGELGVETKTERGGRVFPASDKSSDVIRALERYLKNCGVHVLLHTQVLEIQVHDGAIKGVTLPSGFQEADAVIVATGGLSYPSTGSRGDGYIFAEKFGHAVIDRRPSLIPLETVETWPGTLSGMTLKNVTLSAYRGDKLLFRELGEMLFTHFGISGPLVLSASALLPDGAAEVSVSIDLKPGLTEEQLDRRILRDLDAGRRMSVKNALSGLLPQKLLPIVLAEAGISPDRSVSDCTRQQRRALVHTLKRLALRVRGTRPLAEAIITRGGVSVADVNAATLQSKLVQNLYFAGEVLDVDAQTGGYNLQIAWSTGCLAGQLKGAIEKQQKEARL